MAGRGKEEEGYSVEAQENMGVAIEEFKESLIPIGSEEANKNQNNVTDFTFKNITTCPDCGSSVMHEGGCVTCPGCGFSKCE